MWKRPFGPCGFSDWSVTLAMSGKSRLANHRMLSALLVQEICSRHPGLVVADVGPAEAVLEHRLLEELAAEVDRARGLVGIDRRWSCRPGSTSCAAVRPQQRIEPAVVVAEAMAELEAERMVLLLELDAGLESSSQVSGNFLTPTSLNQSVRQFISWPTLPNGIAFHLPLTTTASLPTSYQPPCFLPMSSAMSLTSISLSSNRNGQRSRCIVTSAPEPVSIDGGVAGRQAADAGRTRK